MFAADLKLAARNLMRHRVRSLISLSAIAFGVCSLLLAGGFIEWIFWAMREASFENGLGHIQVTRPGFRAAGIANPRAFLLPGNPVELDIVRNAPGVQVVGERLLLSGLISRGEATLAFTGEAIDPDAVKVLNRGLRVEGENLAANDRAGVMLGRGLADSLGVKLGDKVVFVVNLPGGGINAVEAHIRGLFTTQIKAVDDNAVQMAIGLGRELLRVSGAHVWVIGLDATEHTDRVLVDLRSKLSSSRFELASWIDLSDFYRKSVVLLSRQIDVVAWLIGMIIVLGISNTLTMSVFERTGEIGTLLAIGTPRRGILRLFVIEGFLLGLVGGLAGLAIGYVLAEALSYFGIPMPPPPGRDAGFSAKIMLTFPIAFSGFVVAVASTTLASIYPARTAARLQIVDALRQNR